MMRSTPWGTQIQRLPLPMLTATSSKRRWADWACLVGAVLLTAGCSPVSKPAANTPSQPIAKSAQAEGLSVVDVAVTKVTHLHPPKTYAGITQPLRTVSLRSQVEGQVLKLTVKVGDRVQRNQLLAQIDDSVLKSAAAAATTELTARRSTATQLKNQVSDAQRRIEQAHQQLQQAQANADRQERLWKAGAVTRQQAETAQAEARRAYQAVKSMEEQVSQQQQTIAATQGRISAQESVITQTQERRSFAVVNSPVQGLVLGTATSVGTLVQPGSELIKLGDFSSVKVTVEVPEAELTRIRVGDPVQVQFASFPQQSLPGSVTRTSPPSNNAPQASFEVTVANPPAQIGNGITAQVKLSQQGSARVVIPKTALQFNQNPSGVGSVNRSRQTSPNSSPAQSQATVWIVNGEGDTGVVLARSVTLGEQANGQVEVLSGLQPQERYVVRSNQPLQNGAAVRVQRAAEKS